MWDFHPFPFQILKAIKELKLKLFVSLQIVSVLLSIIFNKLDRESPVTIWQRG